MTHRQERHEQGRQTAVGRRGALLWSDRKPVNLEAQGMLLVPSVAKCGIQRYLKVMHTKLLQNG